MPSEKKRDALVEQNTEYAYKLAADMMPLLPRGIDRDEVRAAAREGLLAAASRFDPRRGVKFTTFSYYRIRGAIRDLSRRFSADNAVRARLTASEAIDDEVEAAQAIRIREAGDGPAEAAAALVNVLETAASITIVVEAVMTQTAGHTGSPEGHVAAMQSARGVHQAIQSLPDKERTMIMNVYYGGDTILEAGEKLGLSKSWASRLHKRAVQLLREKLGEAALVR